MQSMNKKYSVSYDSGNNTLFVYDKNVTFTVDFNSGTFKRVTKNKTADDVKDEPVNGLLQCKEWLDNLEQRKNKLLDDAKMFELISKDVAESIRRNIKEHPEIK